MIRFPTASAVGYDLPSLRDLTRDAYSGTWLDCKRRARIYSQAVRDAFAPSGFDAEIFWYTPVEVPSCGTSPLANLSLSFPAPGPSRACPFI